jgi:hypothetical protein
MYELQQKVYAALGLSHCELLLVPKHLYGHWLVIWEGHFLSAESSQKIVPIIRRSLIAQIGGFIMLRVLMSWHHQMILRLQFIRVVRCRRECSLDKVFHVLRTRLSTMSLGAPRHNSSSTTSYLGLVSNATTFVLVLTKKLVIHLVVGIPSFKPFCTTLLLLLHLDWWGGFEGIIITYFRWIFFSRLVEIHV